MSRSSNVSTAGSAGVVVLGRANSPETAAGRRPWPSGRLRRWERLGAAEPKRLALPVPAPEPKAAPAVRLRELRDVRLFVRAELNENLP
jgi:hypothetical protein